MPVAEFAAAGSGRSALDGYPCKFLAPGHQLQPIPERIVQRSGDRFGHRDLVLAGAGLARAPAVDVLLVCYCDHLRPPRASVALGVNFLRDFFMRKFFRADLVEKFQPLFPAFAGGFFNRGGVQRSGH